MIKNNDHQFPAIIIIIIIRLRGAYVYIIHTWYTPHDLSFLKGPPNDEAKEAQEVQENQSGGTEPFGRDSTCSRARWK